MRSITMIRQFRKASQLFTFSVRCSLSTSLAVSTSNIQPKSTHDSIFLRHAHSQFNKACEDYRKKFQIEYNWDLLCKHPGFEEAVAYNPSYFDCPLTSKGLQQCYLTAQKINPNDVDVILVSPHQRTLETCANIFKFTKSKSNIPVIVQPLIAGSLWSSCDISKCVNEKRKQFPNFNFSKMVNQPELWFIENLRFEDKMKIQSEIARRKLVNFNDKQLLILEMLKDKRITEDRKILRKRALEIKNLMRSIKQKHISILVISHYYIIQYVNAKSFDQEDHRPIQDIDLQNCLPYYNTLDELLNNEKQA